MCDPKGYTNIELASEIYRQVKSSEFQSRDIATVNNRKLRKLYEFGFLRKVRREKIRCRNLKGYMQSYPSWVYQLTPMALKKVAT